MNESDPYNDSVRAFFVNPDHAGDLQGDYAEVLQGEASESDLGARVVLFAGIVDGNIAEMRFRTWGCPHLIAAAELLCENREKGPVSGLSTMDTRTMMQQLSVPVEKSGRMFLLEDALKLLWAQHSAAKQT
jgi:NifU-like protein involved in Fe-S cluster formation